MLYWISVVLLGLFVVGGIVYNMLFGSDRRMVRSREWCYRNLDLPPLPDDEFCNYQLFRARNVPSKYALAKRFEIADSFLDYPPDRLYPEMVWEDIPLDSSPWERDLLALNEYLLYGLRVDPEAFLKGNTIAEIIVGMYDIERGDLRNDVTLRPGSWWWYVKYALKRVWRDYRHY